MKENRILLFENTIYSMKSKILSIENTTNYNLEIQSQKKPFDNLQEIYQYLNKPPSYKEIEIKGVLLNFDQILPKIKEKISLNEEKEIDENDYEIISTYSQKELLTSLYESISTENLEDYKHKLLPYLQKHKPELLKSLSNQEKNVNKIETTLQKQRTEISQFKKKTLSLIEKEILNEEKVLEKLSLEKKEHEKIFHLIQDKEENSNYEKKLKQKEKQISFTIKQIKLDEKLFKAKISTLKNNLKAKKYKTIEPLSFFFTLGLVYWTSYSNTKQVILRYENKINKLKEKEILLEKEVSYISEERDILQDKNIDRLKEITKKEDELQKNIEKLEKEIDKQKKNIEKKYDIRKKNEVEYNLLIEQENVISKEYIQQYEELKKMNLISLEENFISLIDKIIMRQHNQKKEIKEMIQSIEHQKFEYEKNSIFEIKHEIQ
jgi:hypothetical protein